MKCKTQWITLVVAVLAWSTGRAETEIYAVFDIENQGATIAPDSLQRLSAFLALTWAEAGYKVISRDQLRDRLKTEQKESYKECYDRECQIELGRELAANKIVASQILKLGSACRLAVTVFDLRQAAAERALSFKAECTEDALVSAIEQLKEKIAEEAPGKNPSPVVEGSKPPEAAPKPPVPEPAGDPQEVLDPSGKIVWRRCPVGQRFGANGCEGNPRRFSWGDAEENCPNGFHLPQISDFTALLEECDRDVRGGDSGYCIACRLSPNCSKLFPNGEGRHWARPDGVLNSSMVNLDDGQVYVKEYGKAQSLLVRCVRPADAR